MRTKGFRNKVIYSILFIILVCSDVVMFYGMAEITELEADFSGEGLPDFFREMKVFASAKNEKMDSGLGYPSSGIAGWWLKEQQEYQEMTAFYHAILESFQRFPVSIAPLPAHATSSKDSEETMRLVSFENGFMDARNFGGERKHEGTDIMSVSGKRGELPVVSASSGVVEKKGWLKLGGYRIGIRSDNGIYYYYAHLDHYAPLKEGDRVKAGDVLGYMGDTGYGEEGTKGKFPVHLHFGIYVTYQGKEVSVNPYWLLKEKQKQH